MAIEISNEDCDDVRALIEVSLSSDELPDAIILRPIYKDEAIRYVSSKFENIETGDEAALKTAAIYFLASRVVFAVTQMKSETLAGNQQQTYEVFNYEKKSAELRGRADAIIADVQSKDDEQGGVSSSQLPTIFTLAKARKRFTY